MKEQEKINIALDLFKIAYDLHLNGKISEAIEAYKISIDTFPTAEAHTFLGWAYSLQGRFQDAILECKVAIDLNPEYGNPYNDIGSYLISLQRHEEAIEWLEKALDAPEYDQRHYPLFNLGLIYERLGDWFTAIKYYQDALEIKPDYEGAKSALLRLTAMMN